MTSISESIQLNQSFIGRSDERKQLALLQEDTNSNILIVYGRRRVGKTELIEQSFRKRNILKFEGAQNQDELNQQQLVMRKLSEYANEPMLKKIAIDRWLDVFDNISNYTKEGTWTIYFEELQWLANYKDNFISELKIAWDNNFRRNPNIIVILCGSSPSFMIQKVIHSKALYNRSQTEVHLQELSLLETKQLLGKRANREIINTYLTIGGIPEYLKKIKSYSSSFTGICEQSFKKNSYFSKEYKRIFVSSMAENPHYQQIINFLSNKRFSSREQIANNLKLGRGGRLGSYLEELELSGFIKKYSPYNLAERSKLTRYCICDAYLQFYFKFIHPNQAAIQSGRYQKQATNAIKMDAYQKWIGYAFERYCRDHSHKIAQLLGFSGIHYLSGCFFNRNTNKQDPGYQIDLLFDRDDHVITICEIKYLQSKVNVSIIEEFERKLSLFENKKNKTLHKVLISAEGANTNLINRHYFDNIITLEDFFK